MSVRACPSQSRRWLAVVLWLFATPTAVQAQGAFAPGPVGSSPISGLRPLQQSSLIPAVSSLPPQSSRPDALPAARPVTRPVTPGVATPRIVTTGGHEWGPAIPDAPPFPRTPPTGGCATCREYWIVSTRHCPQEPKSTCGCNLHVLRVTGDQRPVISDIRTLATSIDPSVPLVVSCHGSFVDWESVESESRSTYDWLQDASPRPLQVVFFTWPSDNFSTPIPHVDVCVLGRRGAVNGFYLTQLVANLPGQQRLTLLGHSHGCRVVVSCLQLLAGGQVQGYRLGFDPGRQRRIRTVLAAAALDHDWLNPDERYHLALSATEHLLNLRSRDDIALNFYPLRKGFGSRALGRSGFTASDRRKLGHRACHISELDVTRLIKMHHTWPHYYSQPQIAQAIRSLIYFESDPVNGAPDGAVPTPARTPTPIHGVSAAAAASR